MAYSAGFLKAMNANPYLQTVLAKYSPENNGYEVKSLEDVRTINFDYVITINAMDYFPDIPFLRKIEWRVSTTDDGSIEDIVHITQQLSTKVQSFILNIAA
jgi:protein-tyrosine-phosphatase